MVSGLGEKGCFDYVQIHAIHRPQVRILGAKEI
jgi:hypothetical protein